MPNSKPTDWIFAQPKNEMTVTTSSIMYGGKPILMVSRVVDDGTWMFLDGGPFSMDDAMLVTLQTIVAHDSSVCELAEMSLGWTARRESTDRSWKITCDED